MRYDTFQHLLKLKSSAAQFTHLTLNCIIYLLTFARHFLMLFDLCHTSKLCTTFVYWDSEIKNEILQFINNLTWVFINLNYHTEKININQIQDRKLICKVYLPSNAFTEVDASVTSSTTFTSSDNRSRLRQTASFSIFVETRPTCLLSKTSMSRI